MTLQCYYFNCSKEYINLISKDLYEEILSIIKSLPKLNTQSEINQRLFKELVKNQWSYDNKPSSLDISTVNNNRSYCATSTTLQANWHSDFAKKYEKGLVQMEVQFGKVEAMFKDFCGFRIAYFEKRLTLGIEVVLNEPSVYFSHRKGSISGMAYFDIARRTLPAIGLECPIWLIGM